MATHVALLRGINVGGKNSVAMADLRDIVSSLGHTDVVTYIQSGNVVFNGDGGTAAIAAGLEAAIEDRLGLRPRVVVLTRDELADVVASSPYADEPNPKVVHVMFFPEPLEPAVHAAVAEAESKAGDKGSRDRARVLGRAIYLHTPDGYGRSELAVLLARTSSPTAAGTARNWSTVTRLLDMLEG